MADETTFPPDTSTTTVTTPPPTSTTTVTTLPPTTTQPPTPGSTTCYPCLSCPELVIETPPTPIELTTKRPTPLPDIINVKVPPVFPLSNPVAIVQTTQTIVVPTSTSTSTTTQIITTVVICNTLCNRLGY